ncbi:MAG: NADH-quinone oxidoreductase subunit C [Candidatus Omnitrophica bacterium]|nr:NADH-quinone oxidoreductase subunit C [Candidatus Omnitrophota bacterium]
MEMKDRIKEGLGGKIVNWEEKRPHRIYFEVKKEDIFETVKFLFKNLGLRFSIATGMDNPDNFEMLYHFSFDKTGEFYSVRVFINDKEKAQIDSITPIFIGAEWIEREIWEMLGINFVGHPNLKKLLLDDDWPQGDYPLRKDNKKG